MILAILNKKGGVGKTTLAAQLAAAAASMDRSVLMVDADPQGSALDWAAIGKRIHSFPSLAFPREIFTRRFRHTILTMIRS